MCGGTSAPRSGFFVSPTLLVAKEHAKIPALNSKTWNHPVVVGEILLIRNGEEMVAFRLPSRRQP